MKFKAEVTIMPHPELLDPQGKAVMKGLRNLNLNSIEDVRAGKHFTLLVEANSKNAASAFVEDACKSLLANATTEQFTFIVDEF